jgi:uncharacterized protein YndB with AHSA1/START domain
MSKSAAEHSTIVLARTYDSPIDRVFAAFSDPEERVRVHALSTSFTFEFYKADQRVGGHDVFRFGPRRGLQFRGETFYHAIAPGRRIICTDIVHAGDIRLWVGLTTIELELIKRRTQVKVTTQIVRLDDDDSIQGAESRYSVYLENLGSYLHRERAGE